MGAHDAFLEIFDRVKKISIDTSCSQLVENDWDPFAMIDSVSQADSGSEEYKLLQRIQKIEFEVLLKRFCN